MLQAGILFARPLLTLMTEVRFSNAFFAENFLRRQINLGDFCMICKGNSLYDTFYRAL